MLQLRRLTGVKAAQAWRIPRLREQTCSRQFILVTPFHREGRVLANSSSVAGAPSGDVARSRWSYFEETSGLLGSVASSVFIIKQWLELNVETSIRPKKLLPNKLKKLLLERE